MSNPLQPSRQGAPLAAAVRAANRAVLLATMAATSARSLEVSPEDARVVCGSSCILNVPVLVSGTATLDAVGFDLLFDAGKLEYRSMRRGPIARGWAAFGAQLLPGARLRVGGFDANPFPLSGTDTLAVLSFAAVGPEGCASYRTDELVDDLAGAPPRTGFAAWSGWAPPANGFVAVYPSGGTPSCCYDAPDGTELQVVAHTAGASAAGILGAEFRIEVSPPAPGAIFGWAPDAALTSAVGNPVDNALAPPDTAGVRLAFAACRAPFEGRVVLGTLTVRGLSGPHELLVKRHRRPAEPVLPCAHYVLCSDDPCRTSCMARTLGADADPVVYRASVNEGSCAGVTCGFVAVAPSAWGDVKRIYRR